MIGFSLDEDLDEVAGFTVVRAWTSSGLRIQDWGVPCGNASQSRVGLSLEIVLRSSGGRPEVFFSAMRLQVDEADLCVRIEIAYPYVLSN
eukprot:1196352-Prorocentrum_minimum.AAC.4